MKRLLTRSREHPGSRRAPCTSGAARRWANERANTASIRRSDTDLCSAACSIQPRKRPNGKDRRKEWHTKGDRGSSIEARIVAIMIGGRDAYADLIAYVCIISLRILSVYSYIPASYLDYTHASIGALDGLETVGMNVLLRKQPRSAWHVHDNSLYLPIENKSLERFDLHPNLFLLNWHPRWGQDSWQAVYR